ncbi:hypothetical protein C8Q72DRAFT_281490 [Fomitopsis betulina]|nr:hypothetical protein C8Q72DRAFT_281490 [Fomitopsis betulina]
MAGARGCFNCGGFGHQAANCPKAGTPTCYNCMYAPTTNIHLSNSLRQAAARAMFLVTARGRPNRRLATSVARRGI